MNVFLANLKLFFDLKYQTNVLRYIKKSNNLNIYYDIKYIHKREFFDKYIKNKEHDIGEYYEKMELINLCIGFNNLESMRDLMDIIDKLTKDKLFECIYNGVLNVFLYSDDECYFDLSISSSNIFLLKRLNCYLNINYYINKD